MLEFKPRTHSDPDLPQLLPLPVRPHSSYSAKLQFKEQSQFEEKIVHSMAHRLGLDLVKDAELRWVIRDCLLALKEEGWSVVLKGGGDLAYLQVATEESRSFHPAVEMHRQLAERLLLQKAHMAGKNNDRKRRHTWPERTTIVSVQTAELQLTRGYDMNMMMK